MYNPPKIKVITCFIQEVKKLLFSAISIALLFSCTRQELPSAGFSPDVMYVSSEDMVVSTKTSLNGTSVEWSTGDEFALYNGTSTYRYIQKSGNAFEPVTAVKKSSFYNVFYPYSAVTSSDSEGFGVEIPGTQQYVENSFANGAFYMIGSTDNISSAMFYNVMGVLSLQFKTDTPTTLARIEITAPTSIAGTAMVYLDKSISFTGNTKNTVTLECNTPVDNTVKDFMIVLPPDTYETLTARFIDTKGAECTAKYKNIKISRSKIYSASVSKSFVGGSTPDDPTVNENIILLNEGNWQSDNGQLSYIHNHSITNEWFQTINGTKLGDTPQHIIYIPEKNMVAISMNWSNIVYFIKPTGELIAQTENVPNCRYMVSDGDYIYITSYAHETALGEMYEKGYVAKISLADYRVVKTCEVGYEPEGIALFDGKLFVANTGGYAFSEGHDYENTISVVDAKELELVQNVELFSPSDNPVINLYGMMSQSGSYLMINSPGDYMSIPPASVIFNCNDFSYEVFEDVPCTYNTVLPDGRFLAVGSSFSYATGGYEYFNWWYDPADGSMDEATEFGYDITDMENPYCVYCNPYTGHIYITDAASYASAGKVYEYADGSMIGSALKCYINPGHMVALPDNAVVATKASVLTTPVVVSQCAARPNNKVSINDYYKYWF